MGLQVSNSLLWQTYPMTTMLPAPPKSLGRLGEVLKSSWSAVQGEENSLGFEPKRVICVVMVDGLGYSNLTAAAGHAPFLNSRTSEKISCYFPATTSTKSFQLCNWS